MAEVLLPNNTVLYNVPEGTTKEEAMLKAAQSGLIDQDMAIETLEGLKKEQESITWQDWIMKNLDLPVGIGGALAGTAAGAAIGTAVPVVGTAVGGLVGSIIGGAGGTFGGSLLSDVVYDNELDYQKALEEAALSVGIDVATFGMGKAFKAIAKRYFDAKIPVDEAAQRAIEELRTTQQLLEAGGATLTPSQINPTRLNDLTERIATIGLASSGRMADNTTKVNEVIQENLNKLMEGTFDPQDTGRKVFDIITSGRRALSETYGEGLEQIRPMANSIVVTPLAFKNTLEKSLEEITRREVPEAGQQLGDIISRGGSLEQKKFLTKWIKAFSGGEDGKLPRMTGDTLIKVYKDMQQEIAAMYNHGVRGYNPTAAVELAKVSDEIGTKIRQVLARKNPKLARDFDALQKGYKEGRDGLVPTNIQSILESGEKGNFGAIGSALALSGSPDVFDGILKSTNEAYGQLGKRGITPAFTKQEALKEIRTGYLQNLLPGIQGTSIEAGQIIKQYGRLYRNLQKPQAALKARKVMGEDYEGFINIIRAMEHASRVPKGSVGELFLHAQQWGVLSALVGGGAAGVVAIPAAAVSSVAVLGIPALLAKVATNKKTARRLLGMGKPKTRDEYNKSLYAVNEVLNEFLESPEVTPAERALVELRKQKIRKGALQ